MKKLMVHRATFNKNANLKLVEFVKQLSEEKLTEKRSISILRTIKEDGSILELLSHIAFVEVFYYQILKLKGLKATFNEEILNIDANIETMATREFTLEETISVINKSSNAFIELYSSLEEDALKDEDLYAPTSREDISAFVLAESVLDHSNYHRGQLTQMLTELGVGEDISTFALLGF